MFERNSLVLRQAVFVCDDDYFEKRSGTSVTRRCVMLSIQSALLFALALARGDVASPVCVAAQVLMDA